MLNECFVLDNILNNLNYFILFPSGFINPSDKSYNLINKS